MYLSKFVSHFLLLELVLLVEAELLSKDGIPETEIAGNFERLKSEKLEYLLQLEKNYIKKIKRVDEREQELKTIIDSVLTTQPVRECRISNQTTSTIKKLTDKITSLNNNWGLCKLEVNYKNNEIEKLSNEKNSATKQYDKANQIMKDKEESYSLTIKNYEDQVMSFNSNLELCKHEAETKNEEIKKLTEDKITANAQLDACNQVTKTTNESLLPRINELTGQMASLNKDLELCKHEAETNNKEIEKLTEDKMTATTQLDAANQLMKIIKKNLLSRINKLTDQVKSLNKDLEQYKHDGETKNKEIEKLTEDKVNATTQSDAANQLIKNTNEALSSTIKKYEDQVMSLNKDFEQYKHDEETKNKEIEKLTEEKITATNQLDAANQVIINTNETLLSKIKTYEDQLMSLNNNLELCKREADTKNKEIEKLTEDKMTATTQLNAANQLIKTANETLSSSIKKCKDQDMSLNKDLEQYKHDIEIKNKEIKELTEDKMTVTTQLDAANQLIKTANETLLSKINEFTDQVTSLNKDLEGYKHDGETKNREIEKLTEDKNTATTQLDAANQVIKNANETFLSRINELTDKVTSLNNDLEQYTHDGKTKKKEIEKLTEDKMTATTQLDACNQLIKTANKTHSSKINELTDQVTSLNKNLEQYKHDGEIKKKEIEKLIEDKITAITQLDAANQVIKTTNETLSSTIKKCEDQVNSLNKDLEQYKNDVKTKDEKIKKQTEDKMTATIQLHTCNELIKTANETLSSALKNNADQVVLLNNNLKQYEHEIEVKGKQIEQLTGEKNTATEQWKMSNLMINTTIETYSSTIKNLTDQVITLTKNLQFNDQTCEKKNSDFKAHISDLTLQYIELNNTYHEETELLKNQLISESHSGSINETAIEQCRLSKIVSKALKHGYTYTKGIGIHKIYTNAKNYIDAQKVCLAEDARLAVVNSPSEEELLVNMILNARTQITNVLPGEKFRDQAYIGINDIKNEGDFVTSYQKLPIEKTGYVHWATYKGKKQPSGGRNQNCVALLAVEGYGMNDVKCDINFAFICELTVK